MVSEELRETIGFAPQLTQVQIARDSKGTWGKWALGNSWGVVRKVKGQPGLFSLPQEDREWSQVCLREMFPESQSSTLIASLSYRKNKAKHKLCDLT